jgi:adenylate cyclase
MAVTLEPSSRKRKLAAILHADVVGFSRLMGEDEAGTHRALRELRLVVDPLITTRGGRIVGTAGDSLLADFSSVVDALSCAVEMQQAACATNAPFPPERRLELRIGINLGDVIIDGDNIFGDGVNIAARLEALAQPGTICISHTVYEQVKNKLDLGYRPLGNHRVKNIAEPVRVYMVGAPQSLRTRRSTANRRARTILAGAAVLTVTSLLVWSFHSGGGRELLGFAISSNATKVARLAAPARLTGRSSVAVLPFKNLSEDSGQEYFSDGITEDIISALSRFSNLYVAAKSASFQFKGRNLALAEVGRLLGVGYLLDGSIRRAGKRIRVNTELIESATGRQVWSEVYDAELNDIFAVQDDIARRVVGAAAIKLTRFEQERARDQPTDSLAAYEYVLRGRERFSNATRKMNDEARELFQRAIELDPKYAAAYAALAGADVDAATSGWAEFPDEEVERASALAQKALTLDPALTGAYRVLAGIDLFGKRYELALRQLDRALEINPNDVETYAERGSTLVFAGRPTEALVWLKGALQFDQGHPRTSARLGLAYYFLGRYDEAVEALDRALARNSGRNTQILTHAVLAAVYAEMGRDQDAENERVVVTHLSPFFNGLAFAGQFATQAAREQMLEGLTKAGFH